jgi:concanavalin A-like lectin/glucanase superfamily protein
MGRYSGGSTEQRLAPERRRCRARFCARHPGRLWRPARATAVAAALMLASLSGTSASARAACAGPSGDAYSTAVLADNPIAYYRLNELAGETMCDSSASGVNGTYRSANDTLGVPGPLMVTPDTAVYGNGGEMGVGEGGPSGITGNHSYTLEGWFKSTGTRQVQELVDMGTATAGGIIGLGMNPKDSGGSEVIADQWEGISYWPTGSVKLFDGGWHYEAVTYDPAANQLTAYADGVRLPPQAPKHPINLGASNIRVGLWVDTRYNKPFVGDVAEIAVYPTALSAARIAAHFTAAVPPPPPPPPVKHPSVTRVSCNYVLVTFTDSCTATVADPSSAALAVVPTGQVTFDSGGGGLFVLGSTCTLSAASTWKLAVCSTEFIPPAEGIPPAMATLTITAKYGGDGLHNASTGSTVNLNGSGYQNLPGDAIGAVGAFPSSFTPLALASGGSVARARGTTIRYALKAPASVLFTVERPVPGRKNSRGRCVPQTRSNRRRRTCTLYKPVNGSFALAAAAGANHFRFTGRMAGKALRRGTYRLVATPYIIRLKGNSAMARFMIK